jgi:Tfp pilus assembly protein PilF
MNNKYGLIFRIPALSLVILALSCASVQNKRESRAHYKIGVSYLNSAQYQAAYVEFQKAMNLNSKDKEVHNAIGFVYLKLDEIKKSEKYFRNAVELDPDYSEAFNNLCFLYYTLGDYDRARDSCLKALDNPLYTTPEKAYYTLGRSYYRLGNFPGAIDSFNHAVKRYPSLTHAYYGLALAYNAKRMYGMAAEAISTAIELDARFRGNREKAEEEFRKQLLSGGDTKDIADYLEILNY